MLSRYDPQHDRWSIVSSAPRTSSENGYLGYIGPVFEAADGAIWFNQQNEGIVRWDKDSKQIWTKAVGLSSTSATMYMETRDGSIWIGTATGVNRIFNGALQSWTFLREEIYEGSPSWVLDMLEDSQGQVWVAFRHSGLMVWDGTAWSEVGNFRIIHNDPNSLFEASSGEIWICCYDEEVVKYDNGSLTTYPTHILAFLETSNHQLFGGGRKGLFLYDRQRNQWQPFPDK
jgi:ligand-binding sensor domain-containing protein